MASQHSARISSKRRARRDKARKHPTRLLGKAGLALAALISLTMALGFIGVTWYYSQVTIDLPNPEIIPYLLNGQNSHLQQPTVLYDRDGDTLLYTLENPLAENGEYLALDEIPELLIDATLAASDPGFWQHNGANYESLQAEAHGTLAQRLVFDLLLWQEAPSNERALRERLLATQITDDYGREMILEWYLNSASYGHLAHGVDEAAWVYFGKSVSALNDAEAVMLAAIGATPDLNPIDAPALALEKQSQLLQAMVAQEMLTETEALGVNQTTLTIQNPVLPETTGYDDFITYALSQLYAQFGSARVQRGGYIVTTSLNLALQEQVNCTVAVQLARLRGDIALDTLGGIDCPAGGLLPTLRSDQARTDAAVDAQVVILDSTTGEVLAVRGNHLELHTPGTALTPFVYLSAFTRGLSPSSLLWDIPNDMPSPVQGYGNMDNEFWGPVRLREALANDRIPPVMRTLTQVGTRNVWQTVQQAGLSSFVEPLPGEDTYRILLDQGLISLIELAHATSMLSAEGLLSGQLVSDDVVAANTLLVVRDPDYAVWLDWQTPHKQPVTSAQLAYLLTDVLSDPLARRGTQSVLETGRPAAVKLSQSSDGQNIWAVGYSPQMVVGVWMGNTEGDETPLSNIPAAGLWHALFKTAHQGYPLAEFEEPVGMLHVAVCDPSGMLPTNDCPNIVDEIFIPGNEPIQADTLFQRVSINGQTGRLATVFTPEEYIEDKVFMIVPPAAVDWASSAGIDTPPTTYDVVFDPGTGASTVAISSPEIFSYVKGLVEISGRTVLEDFEFYRVQVGAGLNPRKWIQVGEDHDVQVVNDVLVMWDTEDINGLYAIQLLVVSVDKSVERFTIQVTVDNAAPTVDVLLPTQGQVFSFANDRNITFQAQVEDNLALARVEFYLDGERITRLTTAPFVSPWIAERGEHELRVVATDAAGNVSEVVIDFTVE